MMNKTLYFKEMKRNFLLLGIFGGLILMYGSIVASMFSPDPDAVNWMNEFVELYPDMMEFIGFNLGNLTNYQSFIGGYLYGLLLVLFGLIFIILLVQRLLFKYLDTGSFVYLLSTPNPRHKILRTQMFVLMSYIGAFVGLIYLILGVAGLINSHEYVDLVQLLYLNFSLFCLLIFVGMLSLSIVVMFEPKLANSLLIGVNVGFLVLKLISNLGGNYEFFTYLTPYSLFDVDKTLAYDNVSFIQNAALLVLSFILYFIASKRFKTKDLSL